MLSWIQGATILRHRASDVNRLRHWRLHVRTIYVCPMVSELIHPSWASSSHSALTRMESKCKTDTTVNDKTSEIERDLYAFGPIGECLYNTSGGICGRGFFTSLSQFCTRPPPSFTHSHHVGSGTPPPLPPTGPSAFYFVHRSRSISDVSSLSPVLKNQFHVLILSV